MEQSILTGIKAKNNNMPSLQNKGVSSFQRSDGSEKPEGEAKGDRHNHYQRTGARCHFRNQGVIPVFRQNGKGEELYGADT